LADEDVEAINTLDAQIEAAYQQAQLKEELADLAACVARAKEYVAAYPAADADELVRDATTTLNNLANGEYTTKEEIASAKSMAITAVKLFVSAAGTPTKDTDVTEWFVVNPTPVAHKAIAEGWEGDAFGDSSDGVSEYWNKAAVGFHQTLTLPAGDYCLTGVALQRTGMTGYIYAGEVQTTIAQVSDSEVNSRAQASSWFAAGNGVNEVKFTMAEAGDVVIGLTTDKDNGDHWTVWQSFKLEKLAPAAPVGVDYVGIIEQTTSHPQMGVVGESTTDATVTVTPAEDGTVSVTFPAFEMPMPGGATRPMASFTIENVKATVVEADGSVVYASEEVSVDLSTGGMPAYYNAILTGAKANANATPVFCVTLTQAMTDTMYFGADADAIAAYKQAVGIKNVKGAQNVGTIYDLSGRKVEKMVKGGVYIVNGKKVSFK